MGRRGQRNTRVGPSCHTLSTVSCEQRREAALCPYPTLPWDLTPSCHPKGWQSLHIMETPLLMHNIAELLFSECLGSIQGKYCCKFTLALVFLLLHKSATGHCRRHNTKLDRPLVCSGVSILVFHLTQLMNLFRRNFIFLQCVSLSFLNSETHQNCHVS